jgi:hypothetical protein
MTYLTPQKFIDNIRCIYNIIEMGGTCRKRKVTYYNEFGTFDIETSTVETADGEHEAFMYVWQFYIADTLVIGRTWREWVDVAQALEYELGLSESKRIVIYSHNLSYEFQFERNFFTVYNVFATSPREVVRCCLSNGIEARCSWRLTNMSLAKFLEKQPNVTHKKLSGEEFDYKEVRYPTTKLTERQLEYCANDVIGLHEGLTSLMNIEGDTIATIPYTSTGYVRREFRKRMATNPRNREIFTQTALSPKQYVLMKSATRGGNCHANPLWANRTLHNITSMDMTSAYPAVMLQCKFPMSKFVPLENKQNFQHWINEGYAVLMEVEFTNFRLATMRQEVEGKGEKLCVRSIPYISKSKCVRLPSAKEQKEGAVLRIDNGRVLRSDTITLLLTDIDWDIVKRTYSWDSINVTECYISWYDYLPKELREQVLLQFQQKCELKHGDPYYYMKSKNRLNADFGMMLTDICRSEVYYNPIEEGENPFKEERPNIQDALDKYYSNRTSFLAYQWGTWVTAHCRARLQRAIDALGSDVVYCDTDSAKYIGNHDDVFERLNAEIREQASRADVRSTVDLNGELFELGVWDNDGCYAEFKTLGAKKYAYTYEEGGDVHITVAGLGKESGARWINNNGGLDAFKVGTVIPEGHSGRTIAKYNDLTEPVEKVYNGVRIETASNTALYETSYTFSLTDDYDDLLKHIDLLY